MSIYLLVPVLLWPGCKVPSTVSCPTVSSIFWNFCVVWFRMKQQASLYLALESIFWNLPAISKFCFLVEDLEVICALHVSDVNVFRYSFVSVSGYNSLRSQKWTLCSSTESYLSSSILSSIQRRWASQSPKTQDDSKISIGPRQVSEASEDDKDKGVAYHGPISSTIRKVKLLSLSTCCLSVSLGPVITFMTSPEMNVILKGGVAATVMFFSASTTAALHWFVSPYIHKIRWRPGSDSFEAEMMSWLATPTTKTIKFADIRPAETNRPFVTFRANNNFYFVDADHCQNKALLAKLTPQKPTHESAFKNLWIEEWQ